MMDQELLEQRANLMDLVARWAEDLAHEIKNPLHAMVINLELVKRRAAAGEMDPVVQRAEVVEAELHRVHDLVESLLRLVRPWPPEPHADVDDIFEDLLPVLGARTRIRRVAYEHLPGGGLVPMRPGDLAQVLLNLVDNAINVTPEGARIATRCEMMREAVRIRVLDGGPGPTEALRRGPPFGPERSTTGRAGLGLAVTDRLIRAAGGELVFETAEGDAGTAAIVTLPRPAPA